MEDDDWEFLCKPTDIFLYCAAYCESVEICSSGSISLLKYENFLVLY